MTDVIAPSTDRVLHLRATSGRDWRLKHIRRFSPNVQLMQDVVHPTALPVVVKTINVPGPLPNDDYDLLQALVEDASVWRRVHLACPDFVLSLLDVAVHPPFIHYLTSFCPGGDLTAQRAERSALRIVAAVSAAVSTLLDIGVQSAHGNLSAQHVLIDGSGNPRLSGWGLARYRRLNPSPPLKSPLSPSQSPPSSSSSVERVTDRDDVFALAHILFGMLYGRPFDRSSAHHRNNAIPERPPVSSATRTLLSSILVHDQVPQLHVFRYDINAARGLLPVCGPALPPVSSRKREQLLDADLDSMRGVGNNAQASTIPPPSSSPVLTFGLSPPRHPLRPSSTVTPSSPTELLPSAIRGSPPDGTHPKSDAVPMSPPTPFLAPSAVTSEAPTLPEDAPIDEIVRAATVGDFSPATDSLVERLIDLSATTDDAPLLIFKVLFRLPISKNPVLAFKAVNLMHRLVAEGSAKLTAQAITNDGFLGWIESAWSRERVQNKPGKPHMYTYCFASGEIAWYTSLIRRRCQVHAKFAETFTTHWIIRPGGNSALSSNRREAFRNIVDVVEKCGAILRKAAICKDPAAQLKRCAVPSLAMELSKTYTVLCWIYCTAPQAQQPELIPELLVAHNATRACMLAIRNDDDLSLRCHPASLLDLSDTPGESFDETELIATLKRLKKRKKRKAGLPSEATRVSAPISAENYNNSPESGSIQQNETPWQNDSASQKARSVKENRTKNGKRKGQSSISDNESDSDPENFHHENGAFGKGLHAERSISDHHARDANPAPSSIENGTDWHGVGVSHHPIDKNQLPVGGLQKLSISVRKGQFRDSSISDSSSKGREDILGKTTSSSNRRRSIPLRVHSDEEEQSRTKRGWSDECISDSDEGEYEEDRRAKMKKSHRERKPNKKYGKKVSHSDAEDVLSPDEGSKPRLVKQKNKKNSASHASVSSNDGRSEAHSRSDEPKKTAPKKHLNEKSIPFDKSPPSKRSSSVSKKSPGSGEVSSDYSGGSKEALAAAAQGRKTPIINPEFEVAPYEVQFGPQIGSGGFGVVYKAKFRSETVAVKKIHAHALSNAASVGEFQSEVAVLCTLRHPNILRFVGACTKPPNLMIITEFMARGTLFDLLHQSQERVTWPMRKKFALDTCKGMRYLHDSKLLHRDLKSSNLMLDRDLNCKVGDFGLTRISKGSAAAIMTGQCGTFQYMAVEVLANKPYSEKADVFSFGILLWEMVARQLPFFGMQPMQVGLAVLNQGLRPTIPPKTPVPLCNMMRACWDTDPQKRPSFAQLVAALEAMPE